MVLGAAFDIVPLHVHCYSHSKAQPRHRNAQTPTKTSPRISGRRGEDGRSTAGFIFYSPRVCFPCASCYAAFRHAATKGNIGEYGDASVPVPLRRGLAFLWTVAKVWPVFERSCHHRWVSVFTFSVRWANVLATLRCALIGRIGIGASGRWRHFRRRGVAGRRRRAGRGSTCTRVIRGIFLAAC